MFQSHAEVAAAMALLAQGDLISADWKENPHIHQFGLLTGNSCGRSERSFAGYP